MPAYNQVSNRRVVQPRRVCLVAVTAVFLPAFVLAACKPAGQTTAKPGPAKRPEGDTLVFDENRRDVPYAFIKYYFGWAGGNDAPQQGVVAAVWQDGTIIRAESVDDVGLAYVKGVASAEDQAALRETIEATGILTSDLGGKTEGAAASEELTIRDHYGIRIWSHPPDHEADDRIVRIREALMLVALSETEALEADGFKKIPRHWRE